jgi:hypothetical protein
MSTGDEIATSAPGAGRPTIVAVEMGYGHLRPAHALAELLGGEVLECDRPPLADADEARLWQRARKQYEELTRLSQVPLVGFPLRPLVGALTAIPPLHPPRDLSAPTWPVRLVEKLAERGLGRGLIGHLRAHASPLLTTFFVPALIADRVPDLDVSCVVTDSDINRVWAPADSAGTRVRYFAPSMRVVRRLVAYGVPRARIRMTGFPLPHGLLGGPELTTARRVLLQRLARLDPEGTFRGVFGDEVERALGPIPPADRAPRVTFAVGGAGAQAELVDEFLPSMRDALVEGRLRLALVAGVRREVAQRFTRALEDAHLGGQLGLSVEIVLADDMRDYFRRFNACLMDTDALWTKPSELTFFAALGLPLVLAPPVGEHERLNGRWANEQGAALPQHDPRSAGSWLGDWLADGTLAQAAWAGFRALPKQGLYEMAGSFAAGGAGRGG